METAFSSSHETCLHPQPPTPSCPCPQPWEHPGIGRAVRWGRGYLGAAGWPPGPLWGSQVRGHESADSLCLKTSSGESPGLWLGCAFTAEGVGSVPG